MVMSPPNHDIVLGVYVRHSYDNWIQLING